MTREETIKLLSILKAAYPNSYRGMTKEEAKGTIMVWATQFADIPANVVLIAINRLIGTNTFPPSISEVRQKILNLRTEAEFLLDAHKDATEGVRMSDDPNDRPIKIGEPLDDYTLKTVKEICKATSEFKIEPKLVDMLKSGTSNYYLTDNNEKTR